MMRRCVGIALLLCATACTPPGPADVADGTRSAPEWTDAGIDLGNLEPEGTFSLGSGEGSVSGSLLLRAGSAALTGSWESGGEIVAAVGMPESQDTVAWLWTPDRLWLLWRVDVVGDDVTAFVGTEEELPTLATRLAPGAAQVAGDCALSPVGLVDDARGGSSLADVEEQLEDLDRRRRAGELTEAEILAEVLAIRTAVAEITRAGTFGSVVLFDGVERRVEGPPCGGTAVPGPTP